MFDNKEIFIVYLNISTNCLLAVPYLSALNSADLQKIGLYHPKPHIQDT